MSNKTFQTPRGVRDILPQEQIYWQFFRKISREVLEGLGYGRIDLPHFENSEIYTRAIGQQTDIIQKEIYYLSKNKEGSDAPVYALRPEATAGAVRAYIQNGMNSWPQPVKLYYIGAMFRHNRPQRGRYREFYQLGGEIFGDGSAKSDFLTIMSVWEIFKKIGLKNLIVYANSIGCSNCRPQYLSKLKKHYRSEAKNICPDCQIRVVKNPLRLLDCKENNCQKIAKNSPQILDNLCSDCREHFQNTLEYLDYFEIKYDLDPRLVRGLDYYNKTVFEIVEAGDRQRQNALAGGGRYDYLVENLGGNNTFAVGYSIGIDRVVQAIKNQKINPPKNRSVEVCILQLGDKAKKVSKKIFDMLSCDNLNVYFIPSNDGLRSQIRQAAKTGSQFAVIIGQKEAMKDEVILRDLRASAQETILTNDIKEEIKKRLNIR